MIDCTVPLYNQNKRKAVTMSERELKKFINSRPYSKEFFRLFPLRTMLVMLL